MVLATSSSAARTAASLGGASLPKHRAFGGLRSLGASTISGRIAWWALLAAGFTYTLFQKKLLPKPVAKIVASIFFYPTYPATLLMRWKNWKTTVDETLILGVAPMSLLSHPEQLHKLGVRGVVNMCDEYGGPLGSYTKLGIKQLRLPTIDHTEPSVDSLQEACRFIQQHKERGEKVYVHCKAGHGRAASVALCWMLYSQPGLTAEKGNAFLSSRRKVRPALWRQRNVMAFKDKVDNGWH